MKINRISYQDNRLKWGFAPISLGHLVLLAGISGVGKTQILQSVRNLREIANGRSKSGVSWDVEFTTTSNDNYHWSGAFETKETDLGSELSDQNFIPEDDDITTKPKILSESLTKNGDVIIERTSDFIKLRGMITPKLKSDISILSSLGEDDDLMPLNIEFKRIHYSDQSNSIQVFNRFLSNQKVESYRSLEELQESNLPISLKLYTLYNQFPDIFREIKLQFIDVFPQIQDILYKRMKKSMLPTSITNPISISKDLLWEVLKEAPVLHLKEVDVDELIPQQSMSSGMYRTLLHIADLYLLPRGSVVLIDEFENSLGINCIDVLTRDLVADDREIQFIITSHHPYIINNIGMEHWKIVTRKGGQIRVIDATDPTLNLGKSRHQAFLQLTNLAEFRDGVLA
jgi:AAA domain, putative AbiEii toxin, Type IV TA system